MKEENEEKKSKKEQISGVKVEKTNVGNTVFINIKAIQDIEDCVIKDSVLLKNVDIEVEGAEKIEKEGKTLIRWHVDRMEKGSEINLEYKVYKKTKGGIRYGVGLTKEKLPNVEVTWKEKGEVEEVPEKVVKEVPEELVEEEKQEEEDELVEEEKQEEEDELVEEEKQEEEDELVEEGKQEEEDELVEEGKQEEKEKREEEVKGKKEKETKEKEDEKEKGWVINVIRNLKEKVVKKEEKKLEEIETPEMDKLINIAMVIAIIVGIAATIALIYYTGQESYSDLYIYPDSYSNYVEGDTVSFTYGVRSFEIKETRYNLQVFLGEKLVKEKEFRLEKGGKLEETISIDVPYNTEFPVKVRIAARMNNKENSVHFWLKERK